MIVSNKELLKLSLLKSELLKSIQFILANVNTMSHPLLLIITILLCTKLSAQIEDITPEGIWKDIILETSFLEDYYIIAATDTNDQKSFYQLRQQLEDKGRDTEIVDLNDSMQYIRMDYIGSEGEGPSDLQYFLGIDILEQSHLIAVENSEEEITNIQIDQNWRRGSFAVQMSDGSLYFSLVDNETGLYYPVSLIDTNLTILHTTGLDYIANMLGENQTRAYSRYDVGSDHYLSYYDIDEGFVKTLIAAAYFSMVSGEPGDSIHAIVTNGAQSGDGLIHRVVGTSFNEINVPGGPYSDIEVLWRNDPTNTTLFRLRNGGDYKLAQRTNGVWKDLTSQMSGGNVKGISMLAALQHEVFLNISISASEKLLYNFQSYDIGDTLLNVTPVTDIIKFISPVTEEVNFPLTILMDGNEGAYFFSFYHGLSPLISPPFVLENPNGEPATDIDIAAKNVYEFSYYNIDSSETYSHLYHRNVPGSKFVPLSVKDSVDKFVVCSIEDEVIYKEVYFDQSAGLYHYNFDSVSQLIVPNEAPSGIIDLLVSNEVCVFQEFSSTSRDSTIRIFATNDGRETIVDLTHPRYSFGGNFASFHYNGLIVSEFQNRSLAEDTKLWMITSNDRTKDNCNYKFFNDAKVPILTSDILAQELYIGGVIPRYFAEGSFMNFNANESIELTPGTEVTKGMNIKIDIEDCER